MLSPWLVRRERYSDGNLESDWVEPDDILGLHTYWFCAHGLRAEFPDLPWARIQGIRFEVRGEAAGEEGFLRAEIWASGNGVEQVLIDKEGSAVRELHTAPFRLALEALGIDCGDLEDREEPVEIWFRMEVQ